MKKQFFISITLFAAVCFSLVAVNFGQTPCMTPNAAPGSLDPCFGNGGVSLTAIPFQVNYLTQRKTVLQSDGKILSLFDAASADASNMFTNILIRYNADGGIDTDFGSAGFAYINFGSSGRGYTMAIQYVGAEERIVVAGVTSGVKNSNALRVERYLLNGSLDTSFGTNGKTVINTGYALAIAIQPWDQKILTMGDARTLVRLNANGTPDTTFGFNGIAQNKTSISAWSLAVQSNRRIIAAGVVSNGRTGGDFAVMRFNTDGTVDDGSRYDTTPGDSFGRAGLATIDFFGYGDRINSVVIDSDDRIVAAGIANRTNVVMYGNDIGVARFTSNGQPDTSFGNNGKVSKDFNDRWDNGWSVALQSDGKIIVGGDSSPATSDTNFALLRYTSNGNLDTSFNSVGFVTTDFFGGMDDSRGAVIQIDPSCGCEKIVMVGTTLNGIRYAAATRYIP